jgi:chemotaxis protein CheD
MSLVVVGVADCQVSREPGAVLVTYALGSCIGLAVWDSSTGTGGLLHFMLPSGSLDANKAKQSPAMFADTGVPHLLERMAALGANRKRLSVRAAGGAQVLDPDGVFNIGKRNYVELKKVLWKAGLMLEAERVGGTVSRTVRLDVQSGRLTVNEAGSGEFELARGIPAPAVVPIPAAPARAAATGLLANKGGAAWRSGS